VCAACIAADISAGATSDGKHDVRHRFTSAPLSGRGSVLHDGCQMGLRQPQSTRQDCSC